MKQKICRPILFENWFCTRENCLMESVEFPRITIPHKECGNSTLVEKMIVCLPADPAGALQWYPNTPPYPSSLIRPDFGFQIAMALAMAMAKAKAKAKVDSE